MERERYGFCGYEFINYEGIHTRFGENNRSEEANGGLKVLFKDDNGNEVGFFWMRGSRTEPVFRVCVDILGTKADHDASFTVA